MTGHRMFPFSRADLCFLQPPEDERKTILTRNAAPPYPFNSQKDAKSFVFAFLVLKLMSSRSKRSRSRSPPRRRSRSRSRSPGRRREQHRRDRRSPSPSREHRSHKREREHSPTQEAKAQPRQEVKKEEKVEEKKTLSLAEQKELLRQKKEALLKKKQAVEMSGGGGGGGEVAVKKEPSVVVAVAAKSEGPIPLILDELGRQVDLEGKLVSASASKASSNKSLLINKRVEREKVFGSAAANNKEGDAAVPKTMFDARLTVASARRDKKKSFRFVEPGTFVRKEDRAVAEQKLADLNQQLAKSGADMTPELALGLKMDLDAASSNHHEREQVPEFEWWDLALAGEDNPPSTLEELKARALANVNCMLEHPREVQSVRPEAKEVVIPLMLTEKERKRMRREERVAKQEQQRAQIMLGIIPPPPPKVKLSNMERVFGAKMVENPTAVEAEVRKAMQARLMKHLMENEERKLTPSERREKKLKAVIKDRKEELVAAVFRIDDLSNSQLLWKVQTNAKQSHCSGVLVTSSTLNMLVVEGGPKAIKFMKKLLLRRIDWSSGAEEEDNESDIYASKSSNNKCVMVWEGALAKPSFPNFSVVHAESDAAKARQVFEDAKCAQYWDLGRTLVVDEAVVEHQKKKL